MRVKSFQEQVLMSKGRNLDFFFSPSSVAVVGASDSPGKLSGILLESLIKSGFPGKIYPVNPKYSEVRGLRCYPAVSAIEGQIDLAVFALPAEHTPSALRGSGGKVKGAVIVSGGFGEAGAKGAALEKEIKEIGRSEGIRIIGPNCMGIFDSVSKVDTFFIPPERIKRPKPGGLSIISQSGSFAVTAMDELADEGIGVARVISYGNKADVNEADCLDFLSDDVHTKAVAVYIESVDEGMRFVEAARRCSFKKPVMAVKVGKKGAGVTAARSHTGAIAGRYEAYRAAFKKAGVIELDGYEDFINACKAYGSFGPAGGNRVMIITDGGGMGVGIADACEEAGLDAAPLDDELKEKLASVFPPYFAIGNPLDLTGSATDEQFAEAVGRTMSGGNYDMVILAALWGPPQLTDELPAFIKEKSLAFRKPVIVCTPGGEFTKRKSVLFRNEGFPVFSSPESAVRAAKALSMGGVKKVRG